METSIVVCTHNRASMLPRCLEAVARQLPADGSCEIVVVDNVSTDATALVVEDLVKRVPQLRYEYAPTLGLSSARNWGIEAARGNVLVFLDDDAVAEPGWLEALRCAHGDPLVAGVGGRAALAWPGPTPRWLTSERAGNYDAFDLGDVPGFFESGQYPFGLNMSVTRRWATEVGGFSTQLGRVGKELLCSEEAEFFSRIAERGGRLWYEPRAMVRHYVPGERASVRWLLRRAWAQGRSQVRVAALGDQSAPPLCGIGAIASRDTLRRWRRLAHAARTDRAIAGHAVTEAALLAENAGAVREWTSRRWL